MCLLISSLVCGSWELEAPKASAPSINIGVADQPAMDNCAGCDCCQSLGCGMHIIELYGVH
jgi:hypothetical protein